MRSPYDNMLKAAVGCEPDKLRSLFKENNSLHFEESKKYATKLLHRAAQESSTNIIAILLEYNADISSISMKKVELHRI